MGASSSTWHEYSGCDRCRLIDRALGLNDLTVASAPNWPKTSRARTPVLEVGGSDGMQAKHALPVES
jgi:hypothetical protein